jgi:hypothetical protein
VDSAGRLCLCDRHRQRKPLWPQLYGLRASFDASTSLFCHACRHTEDAKGRQRLKYGRIVRREICAAPISSHLLQQLATLTDLSSLTLLYYDLDDGEAPGQLASLTSLTSLALVDCELSDPQEFAGLMLALSRLQELELRTCPHRWVARCWQQLCLALGVPHRLANCSSSRLALKWSTQTGSTLAVP